jgi:hypothetical protein
MDVSTSPSKELSATDDQKRFWNNILAAGEAEPRSASSIRGASGIQHAVIALGFDESRKRLLVISGEHDARTAAMAQIDVQSALDNVQVLVARPVALDLSPIAKSIAAITGRNVFTNEDLKGISDSSVINDVVAKHFDSALSPLHFLDRVPLNILAQWMNAIQQLGQISFSLSEDASSSEKKFAIDIGRLARLDPLEPDNHFGICPVPLYRFKPEEVDLLNSDPRPDDVRELLTQHGILQYFFPAADQLALGLIDRGATSAKALVDQLVLAPRLGHPYGSMELVGGKVGLTEVIDALQERNLVVAGEMGFEVGPEGSHIRTALKFQPREGLVSKVINRFSFNVDLKNIFGK